ncbi:MAG: nickel transporter permease [Fusobacterium necrophorum]|nr:nickel transporter permease [Fusobacterium necrophorum]MBR8732501.1 Glutathione transport system permease protein GsiD [Fusobacterium necrophorum]MBR8788677.1 Glutathione transport system permease protein GsiD [Fusobacterium necrophorum]MCI7681969.1 ABC transporter permease [Fusobacterium necrophorum]MDY6173429.1 nickel transporter permease [Fusobacterium necrophorum]
MNFVDFFKKHLQFTFFLILAILVIGIALLAPHIAPKDPFEAIMTDSLLPPSSQYLFGTDILGRDLFSRIIYGTRYSLFMTLTLILVVFLLGTFLGILAGYFGGLADTIIMRIGDMMVAFPGLILAIAIAGLLGPNVINAIIAISAVTWVKYARLSRSMVLKIKQELYIEAAKVTGSKSKHILFHYILPNMFSMMLVTAVSDIGALMLEIAALSFLGFGAQPPIPEWGAMLNEGRTYLARAPWLMIYPGFAIVIVVIIFNMLGDAFRDVIDVKTE